MSDLLTTAKGTLIKNANGAEYVQIADPEFPVKMVYRRLDPDALCPLTSWRWVREAGAEQTAQAIVDHWNQGELVRSGPFRRVYTLHGLIFP